MPIYEYRCSACGHTLEALQKLSDEPLKQCPNCDEAALARLISAPSFRLKGKGWYETDFKSDKEKRRNLADRPEDTGAGKSKEQKSEKSEKSAAGAKSGGADKKQEAGSSKPSPEAA